MKFEEVTDGLIGAVFVMKGEKFMRLQGEPGYLKERGKQNSWTDAAPHFGMPVDIGRAVHRHDIATFEDGSQMWQFFLGRTDEPDSNL